MTTHRAANWVLAAIISLALGSLWHLDGPSDIDASTDVAADLADAQASAAQTMRLAQAERGQP